MIKVLVIGDASNYMYKVGKCVKKSEIHIINFPRSGASNITYTENVSYFESESLTECIKKIKKIKDQYDVCITIFEGSDVAYFSGINYIKHFVGGDIRYPKWIKNSKPKYLKSNIYHGNFLERKIQKKILNQAFLCTVFGSEQFKKLSSYHRNVKQINYAPIEKDFLDNKLKKSKKDKKFRFFSPNRCCYDKKLDLFFKAVDFCKTNFEVLQVEWFDQRTEEELKTNRKLFEDRPSKIKSIPLVKKEDMKKFYDSVDGVIGDQAYEDSFGFVEMEASLMKKPLVKYTKPNAVVNLDNKTIEMPFVPKSQNLLEFAKTVDRIVEDESFRENLIQDQFNFIKLISNPEKVGEEWDSLFEEVYNLTGTINRKSSNTKLIFELFSHKLITRLNVWYVKRILNFLREKI